MREIRFESSSCTQDLMGDADFDDPPVEEEDERPPPSAPPFNPAYRARSPTPPPHEDRVDWRSIGQDGVHQV